MSNPTLGHEVSTPVVATRASDEHAIAHVMKRLFDKPEAPLRVGPVAVEGDFAVAGWTQQERGGRALLKKEANQWSIHVCGGDGLTQLQTLVASGVPQVQAKRLVDGIKRAEKSVSASDLKKFSSFEGLLNVREMAQGAHGVQSGTNPHAAHPAR